MRDIEACLGAVPEKRVELFFKWIRQYLRIEAVYGTTPNAVRTQLWIALSS